MDLCDHSAIEIRELIQRKQVRAVEVVESCLSRIQKVDGRPGTLDGGAATGEDLRKVHAFISLNADLAIDQAKNVDKKISSNQKLGMLAGVPFTVKDIFCVKGTFSTAASRILANFQAPYSATPVQRLIEQDGIMLGKVNLDEFTYGSSSESSAFQPSPRNPWNTDRVPGGSSGGNAASVAAGECALSLGTDTAGSIRQPAAFCGVVGLKPTYGRVSRYGLIAFGSSLDCPGPVARSARDAAMMLQVIAGADPADSTASIEPVHNYLEKIDAGVKGMRIGISPDYAHIIYPDADGDYQTNTLPREIEDSIRHAATILASMGAEIVENVPMPNTRFGIPAYFVISRVEASSNLHRFDGVKYGYRSNDSNNDLKRMYRKSRSEGFGPQPKLRILMGLYVSSAQYSQQYYKRALSVRAMIRKDFEHAFDPAGPYRLDALLTPTTPTAAFPIGKVYGDSVLMQYADQLTVPANHAGTPAISIPAGLDSEGLPIGIQFLGNDFEEAKLLQIANAYETATKNEDWRNKKPQVIN